MNFIEFLKNIDKDRLFDLSKHKIETSNILIDQSNWLIKLGIQID